LAGVRARGASKKFRTLLLISATTETSNFKFGTQFGFGEQGSETRVDTKNPAGFFIWVNPPKKPGKKTHPKFDPVSFLVLLNTKDFVMFKALIPRVVSL